eukprot:13981280-Alexandrium_andersonii.AAC.1
MDTQKNDSVDFYSGQSACAAIKCVDSPKQQVQSQPHQQPITVPPHYVGTPGVPGTHSHDSGVIESDSESIR